MPLVVVAGGVAGGEGAGAEVEPRAPGAGGREPQVAVRAC